MEHRITRSRRLASVRVRRDRRVHRRRIPFRRRIDLNEPASMDFGNTTGLSGELLHRLCLDGIEGWSVGAITVRVRYTRSTPFSGTCIYEDRRIYVNLGRHLRYPYRMKTNLARVCTLGSGWRRPIYRLEMRDAYQLAVFIFMHELYHLLVYRAGRNTRQKESMCDRFAARYLVDRFGCQVRAEQGHLVPRAQWDFQDLDGFVAAARPRRSTPAV
jgi:hypothetical protein